MIAADIVQASLYLIFGAFLVKLLWNKIPKEVGKSKPLPPGPPKLPLIGNLHQLRHPLHRVLDNLSRKYGDIMLLQLGHVPTLVISSPVLAREVIRNHDTTFGGRASRFAVDMVTYGSKDIVFSPYGEYWREVRKIAVLELLSPKRVLSFESVRKDEVHLLLESVASFRSSPFDLTKLLHALANNVLCRVAFGRKFDAAGRKTPQELLEETQFLVGSISIPDFFPWMTWITKVNGFEKRVKQNCKELDELYEQVIEDHLNPSRPQTGSEDLVDVLLRLQRGYSGSAAINKNLVKALIADMFIAGTDTTAATLVWAMTELLRHPEALGKAQAEVRGKIKKERVEEGDLNELSYVKGVIKETLRLHAPTPLLIPRKTVAECEIRGYRVPANTTVFFNTLSNGTDTESWEKPLEFWPDRFVGSEVDFKGQHFQLIPFGVGRRSCPGMHFASVVMELVLANLLHSFNWELPPGLTHKDIDMEEGVGIVVNKKSPLLVVAKVPISC